MTRRDWWPRFEHTVRAAPGLLKLSVIVTCFALANAEITTALIVFVGVVVLTVILATAMYS